MLHRNMQMK